VVADDEPARKELKFEAMPKGWVIGMTSYVKAVLADQKDTASKRQLMGASTPGVKEEVWLEEMTRLLPRLKLKSEELAVSGKSVDWKLAIASALKALTTVTNRWLAENLHMGNLHEVSWNPVHAIQETVCG
jgi:hypothetical protein